MIHNWADTRGLIQRITTAVSPVQERGQESPVTLKRRRLSAPVGVRNAETPTVLGASNCRVSRPGAFTHCHARTRARRFGGDARPG
jgi:hypothetical protein